MTPAGLPNLPFRRIVLVGIMGSGKSTVGRLLAREIGWRFTDLDEQVEQHVGLAVPEIFEKQGEAEFRRLEDRLARELLRQDDLVLASGGGWPCREGRLASMAADTLTVWLGVPPETVIERTAFNRRSRPLLDVEDPLARVRELLVEREPYYRQARWWIDTKRRAPQEVVRLLVERLRTAPERPLRA